MKEGLRITDIKMSSEEDIFQKASRLNRLGFRIDVEACIASTGIDMKKLGQNVLADAKDLGEELQKSLEER